MKRLWQRTGVVRVVSCVSRAVFVLICDREPGLTVLIVVKGMRCLFWACMCFASVYLGFSPCISYSKVFSRVG